MTEPQPQAVLATITGKDLLDRLDGLTSAFNDLNRKLDDIPGKVADHEARLRQLERGHWSRIGASSLVSALLSSGIVAVVIEVVIR